MNWLREFWARINGTRCALLEAENARLAETNLALEEEVAQLRKEVRAMVNTALSQAGVAPLPPVADETPKPMQRVRHLTFHQQRKVGEATSLREQVKLGTEIRERVDKRIAGGK